MSRFNFELDTKLRDRVRSWPPGVRSSVFRAMLEMAADLYDLHGPAALGAIVGGDFHLESKKLSKKHG